MKSKLTHNIKGRIVSLLAIAVICCSVSCTSAHVVLQWPVTWLAQPVLIYQCVDAKCKTLSDDPLSYVTQVPEFNGNAPAPITFLNPGTLPVRYKVFRSQVLKDQITKTSQWNSCILSLSAQGGVDSTGTCAGVVANTDQSSPNVYVYTFGTSSLPKQEMPPDGYFKKLYNNVPQRTIAFINQTGKTICLNAGTAFHKKKCTGTGDVKVDSGDTYTIEVLKGGLNSGAMFVTGYYDDALKKWVYSGHLSSGVYAGVMEYTLYPADSQPDHSVGVSDLDLSIVNGYNAAAFLMPVTPTVCSSTVNGTTSFRLYDDVSVMAAMPASGKTIQNACPSSNVVTDGNAIGCLSPCQLAQKNQYSDADTVCCTSMSEQQCTASSFFWPPLNKKITHEQLPYVKGLGKITKNVYLWQYDDDNGNFSCDPAASFIYSITAVAQ